MSLSLPDVFLIVIGVRFVGFEPKLNSRASFGTSLFNLGVNVMPQLHPLKLHQSLLLQRVHDKVHAHSALLGVFSKPLQRPLLNSVFNSPASKVADKRHLVLRPGTLALLLVSRSLLDLENVSVFEIGAPRVHLVSVRVDNGLFNDPRLGNMSQKGLDKTRQTALFENQTGCVQLAVCVNVPLNCVCSQNMGGVGVGVAVKEGQRDGGKVVTGLVPGTRKQRAEGPEWTPLLLHNGAHCDTRDIAVVMLKCRICCSAEVSKSAGLCRSACCLCRATPSVHNTTLLTSQ